MRRQNGFTLVELVVAMALMIGLTAAVFGALEGAPDAYAAQNETVDMYQRARVAVDALHRDLVGASLVIPYRWGVASPDPPGTFKPDAVTAVGAGTTTYWLKSDDASGTCQLMSRAGGGAADVPVVDSVVGLSFAYFGDGLFPLEPSQLTDGPWLPDQADPSRWDADLARVRLIAVTVRVQSAIASLRGPAGVVFARGGTAQAGRRWVPDVTLRFLVAPRNIHPGS